MDFTIAGFDFRARRHMDEEERSTPELEVAEAVATGSIYDFGTLMRHCELMAPTPYPESEIRINTPVADQSGITYGSLEVIPCVPDPNRLMQYVGAFIRVSHQLQRDNVGVMSTRDQEFYSQTVMSRLAWNPTERNWRPYTKEEELQGRTLNMLLTQAVPISIVPLSGLRSYIDAGFQTAIDVETRKSNRDALRWTVRGIAIAAFVTLGAALVPLFKGDTPPIVNVHVSPPSQPSGSEDPLRDWFPPLRLPPPEPMIRSDALLGPKGT